MYTPGGGTTLLYLKRYRDEVVQALKAEGLDDEVFGADILFDALTEPMRQIAENGACVGGPGWPAWPSPVVFACLLGLAGRVVWLAWPGLVCMRGRLPGQCGMVVGGWGSGR